MKKAVVRTLAVVGIGFVTGTGVALAQTGPSGPGAGPPADAPPAAYRPGLGDLMTMTVQPRHAKLWIAGRERNWTYVAYEVHELQEAFDDRPLTSRTQGDQLAVRSACSGVR